MKTIIEALYAIIAAAAPWATAVDIWNNQTDHFEEEQPIALPAIFIEVEVAEFDPEIGEMGVTMEFTLHLVVENYEESSSISGQGNLEGFGLADNLVFLLAAASICGEFNGWKVCGSTIAPKAWKREYRENITDFQLTYRLDASLCKIQ